MSADEARRAKHEANGRDAELEARLSAARAGDKRAIGRLFDLAEDRRPERRAEADALLDRLFGESLERGHTIAVTGPPGAGKSTLISALIGALRAGGKTVGVIAVDPSSRASQGALLGDRIRFEHDPADRGVFARSMASRGEQGGLSERSFAGVVLLRACLDVVLIETVGVGQSECDAADLADTTALVVQPGSGDVLQFLKAGVMETPDLFIVNKSDLGEPARRAEADLISAMASLGGAERGGGPAPVLLASAREKQGMDAILDAAEKHRERLASRGLAAARKRQAAYWMARTVEAEVGRRGLAAAGGVEKLAEGLSAALSPAELRPFARLAEILA